MQELPGGHRLLEELAIAPGSRLVRARVDAGAPVRMVVLDPPSGSGRAQLLRAWCATLPSAVIRGEDEKRVWVAVEESPVDPDRTVVTRDAALAELPARLHELMREADEDRFRTELLSLGPADPGATVIDPGPTVALDRTIAQSSGTPGMDTAFGAQLFAGFRIEGTLGKGGMGVVYRAFDPHLERPVAIKMVLSQFLGPEGKQRFLSEARAASRINHPHVVTVYSAGEVDGNPYMAMELVEGESLRALMQHERLDWRRALRWTADLLDGLAPLHEQGILHRDIKPDNVLVTPEGVVKLVDFGLAKGAGAAEPRVLMGTVFYMSPEQARREDVDAATDVFSMGVMLYEMLSGALPFKGNDIQTVINRICTADAPAMDVPRGMPAEVEVVLAKALTKDRTQRFGSAAEFRDELERILDEAAAAARLNRRRWIVGSAVAVALFAILGFWVGSLLLEPEVDTTWVESISAAALEEMSAGEIADARAKLEVAVVADPSYALAWNNWGLLEAGLSELDLADSLYTRAIQEDPEYAVPHFNRASIHEARQDFAAAERDYRTAIAIDPAFAYAYNNLGYLLMDLGRLDEAAATLERGRGAIAPEDAAMPYLARTSGRIALRRGDPEAALRFFEQARAGLPPDAAPELDALIAEAQRALD